MPTNKTRPGTEIAARMCAGVAGTVNDCKWESGSRFLTSRAARAEGSLAAVPIGWAGGACSARYERGWHEKGDTPPKEKPGTGWGRAPLRFHWARICQSVPRGEDISA